VNLTDDQTVEGHPLITSISLRTLAVPRENMEYFQISMFAEVTD
jgi:hypothetical protein